MMADVKYSRVHYHSIPQSLNKDITLVGHLKGGHVLELPDNKSVTLKNFSGDNLTDKYVEVRGSLSDTQSFKTVSFSDFGKEFGILF